MKIIEFCIVGLVFFACSTGQLCKDKNFMLKDKRLNRNAGRVLIKGKYCIESWTQSSNALIKGYVFERRSCKPLRSANVFLKGTEKGTSTYDNGFFLLDVDEGAQILEIRLVGYSSLVTKRIIVDKGEEVVINVFLGEDSIN